MRPEQNYASRAQIPLTRVTFHATAELVPVPWNTISSPTRAVALVLTGPLLAAAVKPLPVNPSPEAHVRVTPTLASETAPTGAPVGATPPLRTAISTPASVEIGRA